MALFIFMLAMPAFIHGSIESCESRCKHSFPLHTFPKKESFYACLRGCRLERIEQVSQNLGKLPKTPEKTCEKDCQTAYQNEDSRNACKIGCQSAQPPMQNHDEMLKMERHKAGFDDSFVILHPVYVIKRYCSGVFNIAVSYISQKGPSRSYSQTMAVEFTDGSRILHIQSVSEVSIIGDGGRKVPFLKAKGRAPEKSSWLDCVSYKAGLPKWLLGSVLFITVLSVIYLCFSCYCEEEHEKLHKFDDIFTMSSGNPSKIPLFLEIDQAPPLPPKTP